MARMSLTVTSSNLLMQCDFDGCLRKLILAEGLSPGTPQAPEGWVTLCPEHAHFASLAEPAPPKDADER